MIDEIVVDAPQPNFQPMKTGTLPFDLIIKNGLKKYEVHGIIMSSISKKIYKILSDDPKKKLIELDYPDRIDILSQVIDFCYGFNFTINSSNFEVTYLIYCRLSLILLTTTQCFSFSGILQFVNILSILFIQPLSNFSQEGRTNRYILFTYSYN